MGNVNDQVLQRLTRVYGTPRHTDDLEGFFDEYERTLAGYDDAVLEKAIDYVIANHDTTFWPAPGVINKACRACLPPQRAYPVFGSEPEPERNPMVAARIDKMAKDAISHMQAVKADPVTPTAPERVDAKAWAEMLDKTPNRGMHGLTYRSRRMMGDE